MYSQRKPGTLMIETSKEECSCWCPTWSVDDQQANWICVSSLDGLLVQILGCIAAHTHGTHNDINQYPKKKEKIIDPMHNCCFIFVCLFACCKLLFFQILFHFTGIATEPDWGFSVMGPRSQGHVHRQSAYTVATTISSCQVNTASRWGIKQLGFRLVLFFFYFPMKAAGSHVHSTRGKSLVPAS